MGASKRLTWRRAVVYAAIAALLLLARPQPALFAIGATLVALGMALRLWAAGHLRKNKKVVTSGPYAHVKNPLYLGTCLAVIGFCIAASDPHGPSRWVLYALLPFALVVFFGLYLPYKKRVEGARLLKRFGESAADYLRSVPDFIPSPRRWPAAEALPWNAALIRENSEQETLAVALLGLLLVAAKFFIPWPAW